MNEKEVIEKLFYWWKESYPTHEYYDNEYSTKQQKCIFLSSAIIGITTYDDELDIEFGEMILDTLMQIKNKTTFEYIKDPMNYRKYILSCNFISDWIDWGTSIRGAWFDYYGGRIEPSEYLPNVGYGKEFIMLNEDFMNWFLKFLNE